MKTFTSLFLAASLITSAAFACGGEDLTDADILESQEVAAVTAKIAEVTGEQVQVSEILRTGNVILNIDKQEVASAMCAAKYHHVFYTSTSGSGLLCMTTFEPGYPGQIKAEGREIRVACKSDAKVGRIIVPFVKKYN